MYRLCLCLSCSRCFCLTFSMSVLAVLGAVLVFALALAMPLDFYSFCARVRLIHLAASLPVKTPLNLSAHLLVHFSLRFLLALA